MNSNQISLGLLKDCLRFFCLIIGQIFVRKEPDRSLSETWGLSVTHYYITEPQHSETKSCYYKKIPVMMDLCQWAVVSEWLAEVVGSYFYDAEKLLIVNIQWSVWLIPAVSDFLSIWTPDCWVIPVADCSTTAVLLVSTLSLFPESEVNSSEHLKSSQRDISHGGMGVGENLCLFKKCLWWKETD